jgi:hypothetical protein
MTCKLMVITLATVWIGLGAGVSPALGDGGTLRFSGRRGDLLITVFTAPTPLRAGPIDLSVLVQDASTGRPLTNLPIEVRASRTTRGEVGIHAEATSEAATNKLLRAARLELPEPGRWHFELSVRGVDSAHPIRFDVDVAPPPPPWLQMSPWIAWPLVPIGLFAVHQFRLRRRPA